MKKIFVLLALSSLLLTMPSCKKWYYCKCILPSGLVDWEGEIEATSKAKAEKINSPDCSGTSVCE